MKQQEDIKKLIQKINDLASKIKRNINLMEVCGTHTQEVARHGIRQLMPANVRLTTGPGCPVCVTAQEDIDAVVNLALAGVPIATYGDILRVPSFVHALAGKPGQAASLDEAREQGAKVFTVYSVEDALEIQKEYPNLVFFGLGFETTAPMTAYAIKKGLAVYSVHKLFLPAMEALLKIGELKIDGFICPGHVSTIIGAEPYKKLNAHCVIAGFEPEDILAAIYLLLKQIKEKRREVENEYIRSVRSKGNPLAHKSIFEIFRAADGNWRGFGIIPRSGLEIKREFAQFDAKIKYKNIIKKNRQPTRFAKAPALTSRRRGEPARRATDNRQQSGCRCGEIIRGLKSPQECPMFKKVCAPESPVGPCMVSVEGACNVKYRYGK